MTHMNDQSLYFSNSSNTPKHHVNWHEAASCAIQIELRDYAGLLEFQPEFILGKNSYRIDLLVVKKLSEQFIPKNIARIFKIYNLFEIKGIHSSISISSYYKTIGYAGIFINQVSSSRQYSSLDISITFLTFRYPRKLIKHLKSERHLTVEKSSPGIYDITRKLPPEKNLYLSCLTDHLGDVSLINRLTDDYTKHKDQDIYTKYLNQLTTANFKTKGESLMICEGLFNLFGTSSAEIIAHAKEESDAYYLPKLNKLSSQNDYLINLLRQNNIAFDLNAASNEVKIPNQ